MTFSCYENINLDIEIKFLDSTTDGLEYWYIYHGNNWKWFFYCINLWNEIKNILPDEIPENTIGRPIVPYRKVLDGILFVLKTGCQWKMLPKEYGSGSTYHRRFQERRVLDIFDKLWIRLLKIYNNKRIIKWIWQ